ncbi:MAG: sensor histidine kinase, partial [Dehalococcoidia bacterium]
LDELTQMEEITRDLYADVREAILGLRTGPHRDGSLVPALREYLDSYRETSSIEAKLQVSSEAESLRLPLSTEIQLMRIIQEALSNVRKHAKATAVSIRFEQRDSGLEVLVADDGQGFDPTRLRSAGWPRFGLQTMQERAQAVGGTFTIETAPGKGTRIVVRIPLKEA